MQLGRWARRAKSSQALALRSKIVLACADGLDNTQVAEKLGCHVVTVGKWRARFVEHGIGPAGSRRRPSRPSWTTSASPSRTCGPCTNGTAEPAPPPPAPRQRPAPGRSRPLPARRAVRQLQRIKPIGGHRHAYDHPQQVLPAVGRHAADCQQNVGNGNYSTNL
nr:helix-turn-helix domain-containing protein [Promicromonospora panici]